MKNKSYYLRNQYFACAIIIVSVECTLVHLKHRDCFTTTFTAFTTQGSERLQSFDISQFCFPVSPSSLTFSVCRGAKAYLLFSLSSSAFIFLFPCVLLCRFSFFFFFFCSFYILCYRWEAYRSLRLFLLSSSFIFLSSFTVFSFFFHFPVLHFLRLFFSICIYFIHILLFLFHFPIFHPFFIFLYFIRFL